MRNWEDYKVGFGDFDREFWLGEDLLPICPNSDIMNFNSCSQYHQHFMSSFYANFPAPKKLQSQTVRTKNCK